tara:strand:+ start:498 stop:914 length:417 start_codon:yes stop_codon:yes gene_type:complete
LFSISYNRIKTNTGVNNIFFLSNKLNRAFLPSYPKVNENQTLRINNDIKNFITRQLSSTPFHVRLGLTILGIIFLSLFWLYDFFNFFKKNSAPKSKVIDNIASLNKYLSSFARVYRSMTVMAFYDHPSVKKIIQTNNH